MKNFIFTVCTAAFLAIGAVGAHAQTCVSGFFSIDGQEPCTACGPGYFSSTSGATACSACAPGQFTSSSASSACQDCTPGKFGNVSGASLCQDCTAGTFSSTPASTACALCDAGRTSGPGSPECTDCTAGRYNPTPGATTCLSCVAGSFSSSGAVACSDCNPGSFSDVPESSACSSCDAGHFSAIPGATSCENCGVGTFSSTTGSSTCTGCSSGTFNAAVGATSCQNCSPGTYGAATSSTACTDCDAGSFSSVVAATTCETCPAQTFQDQGGSSTCMNCPAGTHQPSTGAVACVDRNDRRCRTVKDLKNPQFVAQEDVAATDEFGAGTVDLKKPALYCSPVSIDGAPIADPAPRQCCYKAKGAKLATPVSVEVSAPGGGVLQLGIVAPALICEQCSGVASEHPTQCWKVKDLKNPAFTKEEGLALVDEFNVGEATTLKPAYYCSPVGLAGQPITDSDAQQCCYKVKGDKHAIPPTVTTEGVVGGALELGIVKPSLLCRPCTSTLLP